MKRGKEKRKKKVFDETACKSPFYLNKRTQKKKKKRSEFCKENYEST